jgi:hypothetical protein
MEIDKNSYEILVKMQDVLDSLTEDVRLDKLALQNHERLREEHMGLKEELDELKRLLEKRNL